MERIVVSHAIDFKDETCEGEVTGQQRPKRERMKLTPGRLHRGLKKDNPIIAICTTQRKQTVYSHVAKAFA